MKSYKDRMSSIVDKSVQLKRRSARRKKIMAGSAAGALCLALVLTVPLYNSETVTDEDSPSGVYFARDYDEVYAALQIWDSGIRTYMDKEYDYSMESRFFGAEENTALTAGGAGSAEDLQAGQ